MINPFKRLSLKNRSMLNKPSKPALPEDDLDEQIEYMFQVMKDNNGIGLAANQIGLDKRVIVVHANGFKQAIINPEIVRAYGGLRTSLEGCLSFPGVSVKRFRHNQVEVIGHDANWFPVRFRLKGLAAFVVQHEIDHLNGVTIA